jgi:hypothetical protein
MAGAAQNRSDQTSSIGGPCMPDCNTIMALVLNDRLCCAPTVQEALTANGCVIRTRLGIHEGCENKGLILLQVCGSEDEVAGLESDLKRISGVSVSSMRIEL